MTPPGQWCQLCGAFTQIWEAFTQMWEMNLPGLNMTLCGRCGYDDVVDRAAMGLTP